MALYIRSGIMVCAAENDREVGDIYLNDWVHYRLVVLNIIKTDNDGDTWYVIWKSTGKEDGP